MSTLKLRDYQRETIDAVFKAWDSGIRRPAVVLPTGAGKTVVFASLIREFRSAPSRAMAPNRGLRVIVLAHRDELVDQAIAKIQAVSPDLSVGKVKAGHNEIDADVMVCSVQTLASARRLGWVVDEQIDSGPVGLVITDECHHAAAVSYRKVYDAFPEALHLGVTATMARGDSKGLGSVWEEVVYQRSILNLISKGHLTDVRTRAIDLQALNLAGVKTSAGDWQAGDLGQALMDSEADKAIARAYKEHAGARQGIVFTPTVETAHAAAEALHSAGIFSAVVDGTTPRETRALRYGEYRDGKLQVLVNCMVLTEGFDMPQAEVAVIARPTKSAPLYTQMVGRVLRPWPGKTEALVLDLVGASSNGLRTLVDLEPDKVKKIKEGESLVEALVREEGEGDRLVPAGSLAFELKAREVDSFGASHQAWVRTLKGVWFINCGTERIVLWPSEEPGLWDVVVAPANGKWKRTRHTALTLEMALAWGEAVAEDYAAFSTAKSARWRKEKPSDGQVQYATALGLDITGMNRGRVSELIDVTVGSRLIDRYVKA